MSEVMRWKLKGFLPGVEGMSKAVMKPFVVLASDYDALAAQRDEGLAREAELRKALITGRELSAAGSRLESSLRERHDALKLRLAKVERALSEVANWPDGGQRYGQDNIKRFASSALASPGCADGEQAPESALNLPRRKVKTEYSTAEEDAQADAWNAALDAVQELNR